MRPLVLGLALAAICTGCGLLPWAGQNTGLACQRDAAPGAVVQEGDPLDPGQPLAGLDVAAMNAIEVGHAAVDAGLAVTWRYGYAIGPPMEGGSQGYSECWCIPPPDGRVSGVAYDSIGALVVFVDSGQTMAAARPQPRLGWGCGEARTRSPV